MDAPLLATKLRVPATGPDLVPRDHLLDQITAGLHRRLTLVSAPAGFGKTTLLSSWARRWMIADLTTGVAWLTLDESDNDLARFIAYVLAALRQLFPELGQGVLRASRALEPGRLDSALTVLVNELTGLMVECAVAGPRVLILDDYHTIDIPEIHRAVGFLLDYLPPGIHLILACRSDPPVNLARLRAQGQLTEMRVPQLRFSVEEAQQFLSNAFATSLSDETVTALTKRTEGWIAGLRIAVTLMQGCQDIPGFVAAFSGDNRYVMDYLISEVLDRQPDELRSFMLQTSILDRFTGDLCDAVTLHTDGSETLAVMERAGLFIVPLDDRQRWYRYYRLFADLLQRRLQQEQPEIVPVLHRRASERYERSGHTREAIRHALAGEDYQRAARLIEGVADTIWGRGEYDALQRWLVALPEAYLSARPRLSAYQMVAFFVAGSYHDAHQSLRIARMHLNAGEAAADPADIGMIEAATAYISFAKEDLPTIIHHASQALAYLPGDDLAWRSIAAYALGLASRLNGDLDRATDALAQAAELSLAADMVTTSLAARLNLAVTRLQKGQLRLAVEGFEHARNLAIRRELEHTPIAGLLSAYMGNVFIEWNRFDEAINLIQPGVTLGEQGRDVTALALCYTFLIRAYQAQGDFERAWETLDSLKALADERGVPPLLDTWRVASEAQLYIAQGGLDLASQVLAHDLDARDRGSSRYLHEPLQLSRIRLLIARGDVGAALDYVASEQREARRALRRGRRIELLVLSALAHRAADDEARAVADLDQALALAEPEGYVRVFACEGAKLVPLLQAIADQGHASGYARHLLQIILDADKMQETIPLPSEPGSIPTGLGVDRRPDLTDREQQVLKLLATDLTVNEIAGQLFVARSTVRTHVKHLYDKLDVHSRLEALARAQELGLL